MPVKIYAIYICDKIPFCMYDFQKRNAEERHRRKKNHHRGYRGYRFTCNHVRLWTSHFTTNCWCWLLDVFSLVCHWTFLCHRSNEYIVLCPRDHELNRFLWLLTWKPLHLVSLPEPFSLKDELLISACSCRRRPWFLDWDFSSETVRSILTIYHI